MPHRKVLFPSPLSYPWYKKMVQCILVYRLFACLISLSIILRLSTSGVRALGRITQHRWIPHDQRLCRNLHTPKFPIDRRQYCSPLAMDHPVHLREGRATLWKVAVLTNRSEWPFTVWVPTRLIHCIYESYMYREISTRCFCPQPAHTRTSTSEMAKSNVSQGQTAITCKPFYF